MLSFLSALWFIRNTKAILFWLYLWQLKEYHLGRFLDHFRTQKGKQLLINKLLILKIFIFFFLIYYFKALKFPDLLYIFGLFLLVLYSFEGAKGVADFFQKKIKKPVLTIKTIGLILVCLLFQFFFLVGIWQTPKFLLWLLFFDIFTPAIASGILLIFQPLVALGRTQIINKAKKKRIQFKDLTVIGITGSYGKTSTKEILATILSEKFRVLKTKQHQNSEVGISQCILNDLKPDHEIFVAEMGAYNRGGIKLLADIAKPKIGILTGINEQHLATFGCLENIIKAKYELIESLPQDGIAFFNAQNKYCTQLYNRTKIKKFLYGKAAEIFGKENLLGAKLVAKKLGMTDKEVSKAVKKIENSLPGVTKRTGIKDLVIFDATFSANLDGVIGHLEYLKNFPGKKIIIMPCLIELGKASKKIHRRIGQKISQTCDLAIITTKDKFKEIREKAGERAIFMEDPKQIIEKIKTFAQPGDIILLESRVPTELCTKLYRLLN